jgi:hypothetical protein
MPATYELLSHAQHRMGKMLNKSTGGLAPLGFMTDRLQGHQE